MTPKFLILTTATATEVGKTWLCAALVEQFKILGKTVSTRKPVQSFDPNDTVTDADVLSQATGQSPTSITPSHRWYPIAAAPPMAAKWLGKQSFSIDDLASEIKWPQGTDIAIIEGVGGIRSPIAFDGDNLDLAKVLNPDLVLIASDAKLGCINNILLTSDALKGFKLSIFLNRFDPKDRLQVENKSWLEEKTDLKLFDNVELLSQWILSIANI